MIVTVFTLPQEILTKGDAIAFVAKWEKMNRSLPQSAPRKMRKEYEDRLQSARDILARYGD